MEPTEMERTLIPARAVPPGRILRRELEARGWNQKDLAGILGRPAQAITEIIKGTKQITPETAVALGAAFGTSAEFWSNLEARYRLALAQQSSSSTDEVARKARLYDWVPVGELLKRGWITAGSSVTELERAVCSFLRVAELGEEPVLAVNLRHSAKDGGEKAAQRAWVRRVEQLAAVQSVGPFDAARLPGAIASLREEAATVEGARRVPERLRKLGIRFVIVPHLPRTKLDGAAAFTADGPIVALTMRFDRIDYFWFTLLHELAHLALEHRGGHLDGDVEDEEIDGEEKDANELASTWLLPTSEVEAFARANAGKLSRADIEMFAKTLNLHPGLVVGRLHHMGLVPFSHFRSLLVKVREHLRPWATGE